MNLNLFIAKKINGSGLSSTSNGIACVSVAISIAVILAAVAISGGFKKEIGKRAAGFTGEILMTVPGMDYMNDVYPLQADMSYLPDIKRIPGVESVNETAYKPGMIKEGSDVHGVMFKGLALMDIRQVRRLNGWDEHDVSCLEISLGGDGGKAAARRRAEVYDAVGEIIMTEDQPLDAPVVVRQISEIYPGLFDWLALLDLNVLVVMILMMAVAGFNMISSLLIILFERISMIGLLKSLGMRTVSICKVFIYRGGAIVLRGMVWGNAVALVLLAVQKWLKPFRLNPVNYFVDFIPVELNPVHILLVDASAFILMLLIMIVPSLFVARVSPDRCFNLPDYRTVSSDSHKV